FAAVGGFDEQRFSGGDAQTPEERVLAAVRQMAQDAGDKDLGGIMSRVSESFAGEGGMDRERLRGILFMELRRGGWTKVLLYDTQVVMQSETLADVSTRAVLARGDGPLPTDADGWNLDLTLEEESDGEWRVVSGSYRSARRGGR
ncbi:MAG: hypothetical protein ACOCVR_02145, partial [Myxococcota bacterium]